MNNKMTKSEVKDFILEMYDFMKKNYPDFVEDCFIPFRKDNSIESFLEIEKDFKRWVGNI